MKTPILYAMTAAWLWLGPALSFAQPADAPPENPPLVLSLAGHPVLLYR